MSLDPELLAILACPEDKENLIYIAEDEVFTIQDCTKPTTYGMEFPYCWCLNLEKSLMKFTSGIQISELKFS